jgi:hypothetical protein
MPFVLLTLLDRLSGPRAPTIRPAPATHQTASPPFAAKRRINTDSRLVIGFERFRMTGAACEAT